MYRTNLYNFIKQMSLEEMTEHHFKFLNKILKTNGISVNEFWLKEAIREWLLSEVEA